MELKLPEKVGVEDLRKFTFGDPDAEDDPMVRTHDCLCEPQWIHSLMQGRHTIVRGYRGAGKTAIYAALEEKLIKFQNQKEGDIFLFIDQDLDYAEMKERVLPGIRVRGKRASTSYRIVWELFFAYQISVQILARFKGQIHKDTAEQLQKFLQVLGRDDSTKKENFFSLLLRSKKRIGIELNPTEFGVSGADVYFSIGAPDLPNTEEIEEKPTIRLPMIKEAIAGFLQSIDSTLYVVVDRLDEFVTEENYSTQKALMHGLLLAERDYKRIPNIKLTLLFRTDLFKRLNLEDVGADKINYRTLDISWNAEDLRHLVGRRLAFNFIENFGGFSLLSSINPSDLYQEQREGFLLRVLRRFRLNNHSTFRHSETRMNNFRTEIFDLFVKAYFGETVYHIDQNGNKVEIPIKRFLATHFDFGFGESTPRILLVFCEMALEAALDYYAKNPDLKKVDFPLIPQRSTCVAYQKLKNKLWDIAEASCKGYRNHISRLRSLSSQSRVSFQEILRTLNCSERDAEDIIALLTHQGVLTCENPVLKSEDRTFTFPIMYQEKYEDFEPLDL